MTCPKWTNLKSPRVAAWSLLQGTKDELTAEMLVVEEAQATKVETGCQRTESTTV